MLWFSKTKLVQFLVSWLGTYGSCYVIKPANTNVIDPGKNYLKLSPGSSEEEKELVMGESDGITRQQKAMEQELSITDRNLSLKPEERSSEIVVVKTAEAIANINVSNSWSKAVVSGRDGVLIVPNTKHLASTLQALLEENTIKAELEVIEPVVEGSNEAVITCHKSHLNLDQQLQSPRTKRKLQSDSQGIIGSIFATTERKLNESSMSAYKRIKSDPDDDNAGLNQLMSDKHLKKSAPLECRTKEHVTSLAIVESFSQPQESERTSILPLNSNLKNLSVNLNVSASHNGSVDTDPSARALVQLPLSIVNLKQMKVNDLKAIARKHNLKSYSKLKKDELIWFLVERLGNQIYRLLYIFVLFPPQYFGLCLSRVCLSLSITFL